MDGLKTNRTQNHPLLFGLGCLFLFCPGSPTFRDRGNQPVPACPCADRILQAYARLPLAFEPNVGQTDPAVLFLARTGGFNLYLTSREALFALNPRRLPRFPQDPGLSPAPRPEAVRMRLKGASPDCRAEGREKLQGQSNYLTGRDPSRWKTGVPRYGRVRMGEVYPHIDLVYYGGPRGLEYDFIVRPGGDPRAIRLEFQGPGKIRPAPGGALELGEARLELQLPQIYQEGPGGRVPVGGRFTRKGEEVGFEVEGYDRNRPLVIDPTVIYSTFAGGNFPALHNELAGFAVDRLGNGYLVESYGSAFPTTPGAYQAALKGTENVAVCKLDASGSALVYATYLGGSGTDLGKALAVDAAGDAYVTGYTNSPDFPVTPGAFQAALKGARNAFVTELNAGGTGLVYSTYLGGGGFDAGSGIAADAFGDAFVTGYSSSVDFPVTPGAFQAALKGASNVFAAKLNPAGTALFYSTYLGGSGNDLGTAVAVDAAGDAFLTGYTNSADFPVTPGAVQPALSGVVNVFAARLSPAGSALFYSTYLGGRGDDRGSAIALDASNNAYLTGFTSSANFPVTPGAFQTLLGGAQNAFVSKLNPTGTGLAYSTYLGGNGTDAGLGIAVDASGGAYVGGQTTSNNFPLTAGAFRATLGGAGDAFFTLFNPSGTAPVYSTYWGGTAAEDDGVFLALDRSGAVYLAGSTYSADFPTTAGAYQSALNAATEDLWVTKLVFPTPTPIPRPTGTPTPSCVTRVWPDPFNPQYAVNGLMKFDCVPTGATVSIYTVAGEEVWQGGSFGWMAVWNGWNENGYPVAPGIYYYAVQLGGKTLQTGKFLVVRTF